MAYKSVSTPRFYIDHGLWLSSIGLYTPAINWADSEGIEFSYDEPSITQLNPANQHYIDADTVWVQVPQHAPINYVAVLGHNVSTREGLLLVQSKASGASFSDADTEEIVNFTYGVVL